MTESELMRIKRDLQARAKKKHMGKARTGAYVYGTLRKIRGNPVKTRGIDLFVFMKDKHAYGDAEDVIDKISRKNKGRDIGGGTDMRTGLREKQYYFRSEGDATRFMRAVKKLDVTKGYKAHYADEASEWPYKARSLRLNPAISDVALLKAYKLLNRYRRLRELLNRYDVIELMPSVSAMRNDPSTLSILTKIVAYTDSPYHARKLGVENLQKEVDAYVDETEEFLEANARSDAKGMPRLSVRFNPMRALRGNGGKMKTWKLGEYASGGIIQAKVSQNKNAVAIRVLDYYTKEILAVRLFRWPLDKFNLEMYLNELTTSYYSNVILDWIAKA